MKLEEPTLDELHEKGVRILCDELGVANTIRFLTAYSNGRGNYTEERREMYKDATVDSIIAEIKANRQPQG